MPDDPGKRQIRIAFGPVGVTGLVLILLGLVRRSTGLAAAGSLALAADATLPQLRGFAALSGRIEAGGERPTG